MKTKIHSLFIALVCFAGVHPALAQPTLGIAPTNNQAILFWPANANGTNGVLVSTTDLVAPNWVTATDAVPVTYGLQAAVSVSDTTTARFFRVVLVPPTADGMALIPAGSFTMGDMLDGLNDASPTNVYIPAFYMDTNLVQFSQWQLVYIYATKNGYGFDYAGSGKAANNPVQTVDWYDVVKWSNARSQQAGLTPRVLHGCGVHAGLYQWAGVKSLCELGGQWVSVADGSGVGEGGAGWIERATVSVGRHHFRKSGQLLRMHVML